VIFNSVGSLRRLLKASGDVELLLDIVGEEADRLNRMVGDLLDYSRPVRPSLEPVPLRPLLDEALAAARGQIGAPAEAVRVEIRIAAEAATVRADARLLRQALINLFLNAHQAMPRGGLLDVRATRCAQDGGDVAEIAIRDSGAGIPAEAREKIFQPFFTTKAMGTGLGLAVVKRIIEGHGGAVALAGSATGAEFHVHLPIDA
jgi:signal transduction histidine kinase